MIDNLINRTTLLAFGLITRAGTLLGPTAERIQIRLRQRAER